MDFGAEQCCSATLTTIYVSETTKLDKNAWLLEQLTVASSTMIIVNRTTTHCYCNNLVMMSSFFLNVSQTMKNCSDNYADCLTQTTL